MHVHEVQWSEMLQLLLLLLLAVFVVHLAIAGALGSNSSGTSSGALTTAVKAAHLLCLATSWGATVWAIFVGGLVMFLNLPRHTMGSLRGKVFPACTAASAAAFTWLSAAPPADHRQLAVLLAAAVFDLANLLVFTLGPQRR